MVCGLAGLGRPLAKADTVDLALSLSSAIGFIDPTRSLAVGSSHTSPLVHIGGKAATDSRCSFSPTKDRRHGGAPGLPQLEDHVSDEVGYHVVCGVLSDSNAGGMRRHVPPAQLLSEYLSGALVEQVAGSRRLDEL